MMRILTVMAFFEMAIGAFRHSLSTTNLLYELLGAANLYVGIGFALAWLVLGVQVAFKGVP